MKQLFVVLYYKLRANLKGALEFRREALTRDIASVLVLAGFSLAIFFFARLVTSYLLNEAHIGLFLFHRFVSMVLFVFFLAVNLGNMVVAYSTLYKSEEVDFLLPQPISFDNIFILKFLDNFFHSSSTLFLIGAAVLAGYGSVFDMPWTFYVFVMLGMVIPFMLLAAALAVIVLFGIVKLAARVNPRRLIGGLLFIYLASVFVYFQITNPMKLTEQVMQFYPNVNEYFGQFDPKFVSYLPNHWLADSLYFIVRGNTSAALPYIVVLLLATVGSILLCLLAAHRTYYGTWLIARGLRFQKRSEKAQIIPLFDFQRPSAFRPQTEVLLKKDYWQFFREPSQWVHLVIMVFLIVVFIVSIATIKLRTTNPIQQTVSYLVVMAFNGFLVASIALRFVFPVISLEGQSFWAIRSAPIRLRKIYWLKFFTLLAFVLIVAELLCFFSNYSLDKHLHQLFASTFLFLSYAIGIVSLNLGAGSYFANYHERSAVRIASSQGASLTFLLSLGLLVFLFLILVLFFPRFVEIVIFVQWGTVESSARVYLTLAVVLGISVLIGIIASFVGLRSLERDF